ncbi:MAG: hypothetical protein KDA22_02690 [Phycisphaerales bacterium]|nr:hypothetical protein [Phycisphaerales bacterium]
MAAEHLLARPIALALVAMLTLTLGSDASPQNCDLGWHRGLYAQYGFDGPVHALLEQDAESGPILFAGGEFSSVTGVPLAGVARWDGQVWCPVGPVQIDGAVTGLARYDDGTQAWLVAIGTFNSIGGVPATRVARFDGNRWEAMGDGLPGTPKSVMAHNDGSGSAIFVCGAGPDDDPAGSFVAKWSGSTWTTLADTNDVVHAMVAFDQGAGERLVVGGAFTTLNGQSLLRLAQWDGSAWTTFAGGANKAVTSLAVLETDGNSLLFAGGWFTILGGFAAKYAATWNGSWWSQMGSSGVPTALAVIDLGDGPALYAGKPQVYQDRVERWDGANWIMLPYGAFGGVVHAIGRVREGDSWRLIAGGEFEFQFNRRAGSLGRIGEDDWGALPPLAPGVGVNGTVTAVLPRIEDGRTVIYVGGSFTVAGDVPAKGIARWDGSCWSALVDASGQGLDGKSSTVAALAVYDDGSGPAIYAGGFFDTAGGVPSKRLARWDGSSWSTVGSVALPGGDPAVLGMRVGDLGEGQKLFITGRFTSVGGVAAKNVAAWDGATWEAFGEGPPGENYDVEVFDDGNGPALFTCNYRLNRWNGVEWVPLVANFQTASGGGSASALRVWTDDRGPALWIGGAFTQADGVPLKYVARWDGRSLESFGDSISGSVTSLAVHDAGDGAGESLFAVGSITPVGGNQTGLVRWTGREWTPAAVGTVPWTGGDAVSLGQGRLVVCGGMTLVDDDNGPVLVSGLAIWGPTGAPWIVAQPQDTMVAVGSTASFAVGTIIDPSAGAAGFQWRRNGAPLRDDDRITGSTTDTLMIAQADPDDEGDYDVEVATECATVASASVHLAVGPLGDLDGSGLVDGADLGLLLSAWGPCADCNADLNHDGVVDGVDLGLLLAAWSVG